MPAISGKEGKLNWKNPSDEDYTELEVFDVSLTYGQNQQDRFWAKGKGFANNIKGEGSGALRFSKPQCKLPFSLLRPPEGLVRFNLYLQNAGASYYDVRATPRNVMFQWYYGPIQNPQVTQITYDIVDYKPLNPAMLDELTTPISYCSDKVCHLPPQLDGDALDNIESVNLSFDYLRPYFRRSDTETYPVSNIGAMSGHVQIRVDRSDEVAEFIPTLGELYTLTIPISAGEEWDISWVRFLGVSDLAVNPRTGQIVKETWNFCITSLDDAIVFGELITPSGDYIYGN